MQNKLFTFVSKFKYMKIVKMLIVNGIIVSMNTFAQDNNKQVPKKEEEKSKNVPKQEITIKTKSSNVKEKETTTTHKKLKPSTEPKKEEKKTTAPH